MTVKRIVTPNKWVGLSVVGGDTKPTQITDARVRDGDTFYEYDTDLMYVTYDGTNWVTKESANEIGKVAFKDNSEYLLGTNRLLTTTGEQYNVDDANAVGTTDQNTETDMYTFTLNTLPAGTINWLEFGLTCALIQVTGAVNGVFYWYIRQGTSGGWTNIYVSGSAALGAAYANYTRSGKWKPATALTYPIQVKLALKTDGATNMGKAKVNGVSIVRVVLQ